MKNILRYGILLLAAALLGRAQSITLLDNLSSASSPSTEGLANGRYVAQAFTTGSSAEYYTLDRVRMGTATSSVGYLWISTGLNSSDLLSPLYSKLRTQEGNAIVFRNIDLRLEASTTYWLISSGGVTYNDSWLFDTSTNSGDWAVGGWTTTNFVGNSFSEHQWATVRFDAPYLFALEATPMNPSAVPEPSTYAALAGGVAFGVVMLRRRGGALRIQDRTSKATGNS